MNILVIESSPHKHGSSNLLAEEFIRGAKERGHQVEIFDAARADLHPCLGCDACGMSGPCVQKDDMAQLREKILASDMAVFVTPLYYFGMSAQLKTVIDRFYRHSIFSAKPHLQPSSSQQIAYLAFCTQYSEKNPSLLNLRVGRGDFLFCFRKYVLFIFPPLEILAAVIIGFFLAGK